MLLSGNVQSELVATEKIFQTTILSEHLHFKALKSSVTLGNFQSEMTQQWKLFKQRFYWNLNNLSLCKPVLLSGYVQSEHVAAGERDQTKI